jgi:hypothetical protein
MLDRLLGAELGTTAKFAIAILIVLALIGITALILRRVAGGRMPSSGGGRNRQPRLAVLDSAIVDAKRRLVLIRRDNSEHLLLIGGPSDVVVETNIVRGIASPGQQPVERRPRSLAPQELESLEAALVPEPAYEEPAPQPAPRAQQPAPRMREREPVQRTPRPQPQPQPEPIEDFFQEPSHRPEPEPRPEPAAYSPPPPLPPRAAPVAHPSAAAPAPQPAPAPSPSQTRNDPQYADMAQKLEAALRKPATAPAPKAPEPRVAPPAPQPRAATPPMPQTRPMPAAPAPATAHPAPAPAKQEAPNPFDSLEAEMANLLGQDKKR